MTVPLGRAAVVVALAATAALAAGPDFAALEVQAYAPPKPAPAFSLPDLDGHPVSLADLRGKVAVLFFWATWCPDCRATLPAVNRLYGDLKDRGLAVLLINFREDPGLVARTARERGYVAPIVLDRSGDVAGRLYGVFGPPTAYLVDRRGQLVGRIVGARDWSTPAARKLLVDLLEAPPGG